MYLKSRLQHVVLIWYLLNGFSFVEQRLLSEAKGNHDPLLQKAFLEVLKAL